MKNSIFATILLLNFALSWCQEGNNYKQWKDIIKIGDSLHNAKNYVSAIDQYNKAFELSTNNNPSVIITVDRLENSSKLLKSNSGKNIDTMFLEYVNDVYQDNAILREELKQKFSDNTNAEESLLSKYYATIFNLATNENEVYTDYRIYKDLALIESINHYYENALYFFEKWETIETNNLSHFKSEYHNTAILYGNIYFNNKDYESALSAYEKAISIDNNSAQKEKLLEQAFLASYELRDNARVNSYSDTLIELYTAKYGDFSLRTAWMYNELMGYNYSINNLKLAKLYGENAINYYLINKSVGIPDYIVTRNNYLSLLNERELKNAKQRVFEKEIEAYESLKLVNEDYLKVLVDYVSLIKDDKTKTNIYKNHLISAIEYCQSLDLYKSEYVDFFILLSNFYIDNNDVDKNINLLLKNQETINALPKEYGYLNATIAWIHMNSKNHEQAIRYADLALDYFNSNSTNLLDKESVISVKSLTLIILGKSDEGFALLNAYKTELEEENLTDTKEYKNVELYIQELQDSEGNNRKENLEKSLKELENEEDKSDYCYVVSEYAQLLAQEESYETAVQYYSKAYTYYLKELENEIRYKATSSKDYKLQNDAFDLLGQIQYLNYVLNQSDAELNQKAIRAASTVKNLRLNTMNSIFEKLWSLNDKELDKKILGLNNILLKYSSIFEYRKQLIDFAERVDWEDEQKKIINESKININSVESRIQEGYAALIDFYFKTFGENLIVVPDYKSINLNSNSVYIDYTRVKNFENENVYIAYVYSEKKSNPNIVYLGPESRLEELTKLSTVQNLSYDIRGSSGNSTSIGGKHLYEFLWKPIKDVISNSDTIYFSFDGLLNKIPLATLQDSDGEMLINKYTLHQISNMNSLIDKQEKLFDFNSMLCFGGIDYNGSQDNDDNKGYSFLPGTLKEVNKIKEIIPAAKIYSGKNATEEFFWSLSGKSPSILHIATHGFYNEIGNSTSKFGKHFTVAQNPLKRTGILLSNANEGMKALTSGVDGVLTADEISHLDLRNTELVVLSACETALGDIDGSEGVYGLQRAFKMAGVDVIIMSLWEVPDKETSEFMVHFYTNWSNGQDIREAFRNTQLTMSNTYKNNPEKWAAFVLFE
ncbi:MAG: CHAT domain-containing protein [Winogradskyella sp.]|uniref:CHAT domain-containing protein n=1 Tax=Winogradskyella sp. TaxID=1883156 RepID=UPI000F3C2111|nr:CHAT domain-containing protein [Winogradskyella sp.]RNC86712.1 MAG: CHAT domain-containing protein [Winogradskyella sp.]